MSLEFCMIAQFIYSEIVEILQRDSFYVLEKLYSPLQRKKHKAKQCS